MRHAVPVLWPDPGSKGYPRWVLRTAGVGLDLDPRMVGKDWYGPLGFGAGLSPTKSEVHLDLLSIGVTVGLFDGIEPHVPGAAPGIDSWPPARETPFGRIGFGESSMSRRWTHMGVRETAGTTSRAVADSVAGCSTRGPLGSGMPGPDAMGTLPREQTDRVTAQGIGPTSGPPARLCSDQTLVENLLRGATSLSMQYRPSNRSVQMPGVEAPTSRDRGSVLVVLLVLTVGLAGLAQATLARTFAEQKKTSRRLLARQVQVEAEGQLELARNIVNTSRYDVFQRNLALQQALAAADQVIPGTDVRVEQIGTSHYFALRTRADRHGVTKRAEAVVRQASPASAFNLFVIDHPVGVSGRPRGAIHSNRYIDFFFPGGSYRDALTASEGFRFMAGAAPENTEFLGNTNGAAPRSDLLEGIVFEDLRMEADVLAVPEDYIAEITFDGAYGRADLFAPARTVTETRTRMVQRIAGYRTETYVDSVPVYEDVTHTYEEEVHVPIQYTETVQEPVYAYRDVTATVTVPVYEDRDVEYTVEIPLTATRTATREVEKRVWVSYGEMTIEERESSGTVGTSGDLDGFWRTVTETEEYEETYVTGSTTETRTRTERVKVGETTREVTEKERYIAGYEDVERSRTRWEYSHTETRTGTRKELVGYADVTRTREVPEYVEVEETYEVDVQIEEEFVRTEIFPLDGVVYFGGDVRSMSGTVDGRLSLIANGTVRMTGSIQYTDADGDTRMLNGTDPTEPYIENPEYDGESLLAIMARRDLVYAKDGPDELEINASLLSMEGSVGFEGLVISEEGDTVSTAYRRSESDDVIKNSLRRLGGIVSAKRPVATFIDETGRIGAGFRRGRSIMDQNLLLTSGNNAPPPFVFEAPYPTWIMATSGSRLGSIE